MFLGKQNQQTVQSVGDNTVKSGKNIKIEVFCQFIVVYILKGAESEFQLCLLVNKMRFEKTTKNCTKMLFFTFSLIT